MQTCPYPVADLLPHAPPMMLLDAVSGWRNGQLDATVNIHPGCRFYEPGHGVPAHLGIEYMAQSCGAYAGLEAKNAGQPVRIGYLLGTRNYTCTVSWFRDGARLLVSVIEILRQGPMGVFDCRIASDGEDIATARLNVYQPDEPPSDSAPGAGVS